MKDIFINVLFIIVLLFITQTFLDWQKNLSVSLRKLTLYVSSLIGILFVMTFSISVSPQFLFDIRVVPFILGSLYGGPVVSVGLYFSLILYRLFLGFDLGFLGATLNYGLLLVVLVLCSSRFFKFNIRIKLLYATGLTIFHIIVSQFIYNYIFYSVLPFDIFLVSVFVKLGAILLVILFLETMRSYYKLKNQLVGLEKMELVYHLSASISHEVRNGLTSARGFIQLTREKEQETEKSEYLRIATEEIDRTESIIRDFLTFAKPTLREEKEVRLEQVINSTLFLIEPLANMHSIEIHKHLVPSTMNCDINMIQQTLLNIFKNAIEAMPNGGILDVELQQRPTQNRITITDTGTGMTTEQIERLGTPYFSTKGQKGTGLGMMVAYRVIKELDGKIEVTSQLNKGTTFTIYLPRSAVN